jgi:CARDB
LAEQETLNLKVEGSIPSRPIALVALLALLLLASVAEAATRPDLTLRSLSNPPQSVVAGGSFQVTAQVANRGTAGARRSVAGFFLSRDSRRDRSDVLLSGKAVKALRAGRSGRTTVTLTIPAGTPPRSYRVIACADRLAKLREAREGNNCRVARAALRVTAAPTGGNPGGDPGGGPPGGGDPGGGDPGPPPPACRNGIDDDGDGATDTADNGCRNEAGDPSPDATTERNDQFDYSCDDGIDNDSDGFTDYSVTPTATSDPGCSARGDTEDAAAACDNADDTGPVRIPIDDDGDSRSNFSDGELGDPGCSSPTDDTEEGECQNGTDDDGDGLEDTADTGCDSDFDDSEAGACQDGVDNDDDTAVDTADAGCSGPTDLTEVGQCQDGSDNDGDGLVDFGLAPENDPECASLADDDETG